MKQDGEGLKRDANNNEQQQTTDAETTAAAGNNCLTTRLTGLYARQCTTHNLQALDQICQTQLITSPIS